MWKLYEIKNVVFIKKDFFRTQLHSFVCIFSVAVFMRQQNQVAAVVETVGLKKPKKCSISVPL